MQEEFAKGYRVVNKAALQGHLDGERGAKVGNFGTHGLVGVHRVEHHIR